MAADFQVVINALQELSDDQAVPKNIKVKINDLRGLLSSGSEDSIKINKALQILDEVSDDPNLEAHSRTQIWNVASLLENV